MPDKDRLDYKIACMSNDGPPKDHPYLDKQRSQNVVDPVKIGPNAKDDLVDKNFRKILLAGFGDDLTGLLENVYSSYNNIHRLEFVLAETTDEAKEYLRDEKFDYVFTPALKGDAGKKFVVKGKQGRKTEEIPAIGISGYDIAFASSQKGIPTFIYENSSNSSIDENRAKCVGALVAESPKELEAGIRVCEEIYKTAFMVPIKEKCESLKRFLKKKWQGIGRIEAEKVHVFLS